MYHSDGRPLTADEFCVQLEKICRSSPHSDVEPVGILTTQHRDAWGRAYATLTQGEPRVSTEKLASKWLLSGFLVASELC